MSRYAHYEIEVVPRSAIRKGDRLLHIARGGTYELRVQSNPVPCGFAKEVDVLWPGDETTHGFALVARGGYLRLVP